MAQYKGFKKSQDNNYICDGKNSKISNSGDGFVSNRIVIKFKFWTSAQHYIQMNLFEEEFEKARLLALLAEFSP